jgi:hypothetical protein
MRPRVMLINLIVNFNCPRYIHANSSNKYVIITRYTELIIQYGGQHITAFQ